ncbi:MAG: iron-containing redox enzyme family protein [Cyanobacteria bacterium J06635_15]
MQTLQLIQSKKDIAQISNFDQQLLKKKIREYANASPFVTTNTINPKTPWHRPLRSQDLAAMDLETPLSIDEITSNRGLLLHRMLLSIYEQSMLFLPQKGLSSDGLTKFRSFYHPELVALGREICSYLEWLLFSFLDAEIEITGNWTFGKMESYFLNVIHDQEQKPSELLARIHQTRDPKNAIQYLLMQQAPDFLSEASAMGRATIGNFGPLQSELIKVYIDEIGYGIHGKKHSTLFEHCLQSVGLSKEIHEYYFHYLPSSLVLTNYFHYICANKNCWFRYIGALYYTEASIPHFNKQISHSLRQIFGKGTINTGYFDEHTHIDKHHRRMVLDDIVKPSVELYGPVIIPDMIAGFEAFRCLQEYADLDYMQQLDFMEGLSPLRETDLMTEINYETIGPVIQFSEPKGELSYSHIHEMDELFTIVRGQMYFFAGPSSLELNPGDSVIIPAGRLHGSLVKSDDCVYAVQPIKRG